MNMQKHIANPESEFSDKSSDTLVHDEAGFSLIDFMRTVRIRWKLILGTALAVVALAAAMVVLVTPLYSATAVVMLNQQKNSVENADAILSGLGNDQATIQNQVQILTSLELAGRVVDKLHLDQDSEFNPTSAGWMSFLGILNPFNWFPGDAATQAAAQGQDLAHSRLVRRFLGRLSVEPIGLSTAMNISYQSDDPAKAATIANAIANAY